MKKLFTLNGIVVVALAALLLAPSCTEDIPETSTGESLVYQLWDAFRNRDLEAIKNNMAPGFQSVHDFGAYNMDEELELLRGLTISDYEISNMKITGNDEDLIIATYIVSVSETIEGMRLSKEPAPRMTIFVKDDGVWKWIAHANLKPMKAEAPEEAEEAGEDQ
ncbi:MAG: nuclear transport factor 2 family protein [Bacteroidota bacterium]